jgi:16S rRNA (cytosine1407-C5)-methyltransferase
VKNSSDEKKELLISKIREMYPDRWEEIVRSLGETRRVTFRINTIKATEEDVLKSLEKQGFSFVKASYPNTYIITDVSVGLSETEEFCSGKIYIQSLSSMEPAFRLDPQSGDRILDMCAAPGSKTSLMGVLAGDKAEITAVENNRSRFFALKDNLEKQGIKNVKLLMDDARKIPYTHPELLEKFNKVLVDAPCSNEGLVCFSDISSLDKWNPGQAKRLPQLQKGLLSSGISMLAPGGFLVYSTCTYDPRENEGVVEWALKKHPEMELIEQKRTVPDGLFTGFFLASMSKSR